MRSTLFVSLGEVFVGLCVLALAVAAILALPDSCHEALAQSPDKQDRSDSPRSHQGATGPASTRPAGATEEQFLAVIRQNCTRCHSQMASTESLKRKQWVVAGKPDASRAYKVVDKAKPGDKKHQLSDSDKRVIRDFIEQMKG